MKKPVVRKTKKVKPGINLKVREVKKVRDLKPVKNKSSSKKKV